MPIPTRSLSLREPRKQPSTSSLDRTATTTTKTTANTAEARVSRRIAQVPGDGVVPATANDENVSNRRKSLLPQRSNSVREDGPTSRLPARGSMLQQRAQNQVQTQTTGKIEGRGLGSQEPTSTTAAGRRQSLMRPSPLKTAIAMTPTPATKGSTLASPRKQEPSKARVPTSPKKTDMPPPPLPRHGRSISLRQPVSSSSPATATPTTATRGHLRHRSQVVTPASGRTSPRKIDAVTPSTPTTPRARTTLQQQHSPKRMTKPPTPTPSTTSSTEADASLIPSSVPEVAALQTELLQLSLLHSSALEQHADWHSKSEKVLRKKYDSVAHSYRGVVAEEKECQRRLNGQALAGWLQNSYEHNGQLGFAEQIQVLSQVAREVTDLSDSPGGGRYTLAIREFEDWFHKADEIKKWRSRIGAEGAADLVVFIDPLDRTWKDEMYDLMMKLELCSRQLQSLDILGYEDMESLQDAALVRMAKGLNEMINMMIEEVHTIRRIEGDIVQTERQWVSHLTEQLTAAGKPRDERGPRVGMWRKGLKS